MGGDMTREEILALPEVSRFLNNFAVHCGASRAVFEGQFSVAAKSIEAAVWKQVLAKIEEIRKGRV
jgi:hypothetical protein